MEKRKAIEIFNRQIDCYKTDREECIILASCSHCEHNVTPEELTEAMQTAISALKKQEQSCDTCRHGRFGSEACINCRVGFPNHYEAEEDND